jgi:BirA family transcriptional regulator, biotin operon repressor / biotin---[acetyl-CoA-carboxylase] ligase
MVTAMDGDRARSQLAGRRFADVRWVAETDSTNDDVLALARQGEPEGVVVVADAQRAGRGRLGRVWEAPPRTSLLASVLLRPPLPPQQAHLAAMAVSCAAVEACTAVAGVEPVLKWPNDLLLSGTDRPGGPGRPGGKVGGILAESVIAGDRLDAVIVGIGLNVNWPEELPAELEGIAVALNHAAGADLDREGLLIALLTELDGWREQLDTPQGREMLLDHYRRRCATIGSRVRVELPAESFEGTAIDVSADGHLVVELDEGAGLREVTAGDVIHLRPA